MEFCNANGRLQPGFRFHPTDEELVMYYLKRKVLGKRLQPGVIAEVDIYKFHPQDLREIACVKRDLNWYFFCPKWKKYKSGERLNRTTDTGYWKATGNDRIVSYQQRIVGKIKTLVFHLGKPPKGERTDWVMHEYRLEDTNLADKGVFQDSYVLCKIFKKSGLGPKAGEQYGAPFIEEEWDEVENDDENPNCTETVLVDVQNQGVSAATSISVSVNASPSFTTEQGHSGANLASSSSKGPVPIVTAADQATDSIYADAAKVVDVASSSMGLIPNIDDDEIYSMLDAFTVDVDLGDIFGGLADLDERTLVQGEVSSWLNLCEGGLDLSDLDGPL